MRGIWTVARRELKGYFDQPTAYVLIVAFLGITLFLAFRTMYASGVASLRPIFDLLPILFAVFVPAATMRTLAEERRSKTLEWLLAQPLNEIEVIVGKFLGDWLFVMLALAGTIPTAIGVLLVSDADAGIVIAQYIGAGLLAAQFVALGLWASSFTRNQITAFIVAAAVAFALFLIGLPIVQIGVTPAIAGFLARLSVLSHFQNVARGVVDLRDVVYFVSTCGLFIMLALGAVQRDRLSRGRTEWQRMRLGTIVVAALVLMVNLLGSYIRGRIDLTSNNLYTLEQGTRDLLGDLDDIVQVKLFASSELPPELQLQLRDVRDLLSDMRRASNGNLVVTDVDPDEDEDAAEEAGQLGIRPVEFNVLRDDQFEVRRGYYGLAVVYADDSDVTPVIQSTDDLEFRLASAIYDMTTTDRPGVEFVQGSGMKRPTDMQGLAQSLGDRYRIGSVDVAGDSAAAIDRDSTDVIVLAGPQQQLDSMAVQRIADFVDSGGAALMLIEPVRLDPQSPNVLPLTTGLEGFLTDHGVSVSKRVVADLASAERVNMGQQGIFQVIAPYPLWPIALPAGRHAITSGLNRLSMGWVGEVEIQDSTDVQPLWTTSDAAALQAVAAPVYPDQDWDFPEDELHTRVLAVAITPPDGDPSG
ncbi:MAG: Gldg family protein, partial [Gemmatimonadota bacterium]